MICQSPKASRTALFIVHKARNVWNELKKVIQEKQGYECIIPSSVFHAFFLFTIHFNQSVQAVSNSLIKTNEIQWTTSTNSCYLASKVRAGQSRLVWERAFNSQGRLGIRCRFRLREWSAWCSFLCVGQRKCGEIMGRNQPFTHIFPIYCHYLPHSQHFVCIFPTSIPLFIFVSMSSLQIPHIKINILSSHQHFANIISPSCLAKLSWGECGDNVEMGKCC